MISPTREFLAAINHNSQHDGYLSEEFGFLPPTLPKKEMIASHRAWDEYALQIPELFFSQCTQNELKKMPLLSAGENDLPWEELPRASLILSLLACAYWRHGIENFFSIRISEIGSYLPENILIPWLEITRRLGRINPFQSASDLFFSNFKFLNETLTYRLKNIIVENITMLVPSFGNQSERVFYMSFVEIHAAVSPILHSICEIQRHIKLDDSDSVEGIVNELGNIQRRLGLATQALLKITPNEASPTYCDPILWAKTVAIFAVPPQNYQQGGTSGASTPIIHVMDALLNRKTFKSFYGQYAKYEGKFLLPQIFKGLLASIRQVPLSAYILAKGSEDRRRLAEAYNKMVAAYAGDDGFLGKHSSKVFNYLAIATLVGRNQSTSGHERHIPSETWVEVTQDLQISAHERKYFPGPGKPVISPPELTPSPSVSLFKEGDRDEAKLKNTIFSRLEVAQHHYPNDAWIILEDMALDVTGFLKIHPGGREILYSYSGREATRYFQMIPGHAKIRTILLPKFQKGVVGKPEVAEPIAETLIRWNDLLDFLLKIYTLLELQYSHRLEARLKIYFNIQTHSHFLFDHFELILLQILGLLEPSAIGEESQVIIQRVKQARLGVNFARMDLRGVEEERLLEKYSAAMEYYKFSDLNLVDSLIENTIRIMERIMRPDVQVPEGLQALNLLGSIKEWLDRLDKGPFA